MQETDHRNSSTPLGATKPTGLDPGEVCTLSEDGIVDRMAWSREQPVKTKVILDLRSCDPTRSDTSTLISDQMPRRRRAWAGARDRGISVRAQFFLVFPSSTGAFGRSCIDLLHENGASASLFHWAPICFSRPSLEPSAPKQPRE